MIVSVRKYCAYRTGGFVAGKLRQVCGVVMPRFATIAVSLCFTLLLIPDRLVAQGVAVSPQVIVVDAETRTTSITLINLDDFHAEVTLSTLYGYPVTDSAGNMLLHTVEKLTDTVPSVSQYVQIFPHRFKLAPGERRVVRIMVSPPADLTDREYWARLVVTTRGARLPVAGVRDGSGVSVGLDLEIRTILPFFYRKGVLSAGVEIATARTHMKGDSLVTRSLLRSHGKAAFLGTLRATLRNSSKEVVAENHLPLSVFYSLDPRLPLSTRGLPRGQYELEISVVGSRPDVAQKLLLNSKAVRKVFAVNIP